MVKQKGGWYYRPCAIRKTHPPEMTPPSLQRIAESWFLGDGLGTGVDHHVADAGVLCPERNQTPSHPGGEACRFNSVLPDNGHALGRSNVVARDPIIVRIPLNDEMRGHILFVA